MKGDGIKPKVKPTLRDIANDTGLSISTVSRVLSRSNRTYSKNESKILESAKKLRYPFIQNNHFGESGQSNKIALVTELFEGEFYSSLFNGFYHASIETDSEVIFVDLAKHSDNFIEYIAELTHSFSGICLFLPELVKEEYNKIKQMVGEYPILSLAPIKNPKIDTVTFDSYGGGYMVAKHFQELGYKKFGIITGPSNKVEALFRKNGYIDHINEMDELELVWSYQGDYSIKMGMEAFDDFSAKNLKDVAIFGSNDHACFGFLKKAIQSGYAIPDDFIISGYDDLSFCDTFIPELTSIATNFFELGKTAIRIIEKKVQGENDSYGHIFSIPVSIKKRTSTIGNDYNN